MHISQIGMYILQNESQGGENPTKRIFFLEKEKFLRKSQKLFAFQPSENAKSSKTFCGANLFLGT